MSQCRRALRYLDTVISNGRKYTEEELSSIGIVPHSRALVLDGYGQPSVFYVPEGEKLSDMDAFTYHSVVTGVGLIIMGHSTRYKYQSAERGTLLATFLFSSEEIPREMLVICVDSEMVSKMDPAVLEEHSVAVLYDDAGVSGINPRYPKELLDIDIKSHVVWRGEVPDNMVERQSRRMTAGIREQVVERLNGILDPIISIQGTARLDFSGQMTYSGKHDLALMIKALQAMSYGYIDLASIVDDTQMPFTFSSFDDQKAEWIEQNVVFTNKDALNALNPAIMEPDYSEIKDIARIWKATVREYGVTLGNRGSVNIDGIREFGKLVGVDSMVEAYYSGVPIADIVLDDDSAPF